MLSAGSFLRRKTFCELKGETACHLSRYRESLLHKARQSRAGEGRFYLSTFNFQFACAAMHPKKFPAGRNEVKPSEEKRYEMCFDYFIVNV